VAPSEDFPEDVWSAEDSLAFAELAGGLLPACQKDSGEYSWVRGKGGEGEGVGEREEGGRRPRKFGFLPNLSGLNSDQERRLSLYLPSH